MTYGGFDGGPDDDFDGGLVGTLDAGLNGALDGATDTKREGKHRCAYVRICTTWLKNLNN